MCIFTIVNFREPFKGMYVFVCVFLSIDISLSLCDTFASHYNFYLCSFLFKNTGKFNIDSSLSSLAAPGNQTEETLMYHLAYSMPSFIDLHNMEKADTDTILKQLKSITLGESVFYFYFFPNHKYLCPGNMHNALPNAGRCNNKSAH